MQRNLQENRPQNTIEALVLGAILSLGCQRPPQNACDNAPIMQCLTPPICGFDDKVGCVVCKCAAPAYVPAQQLDPTLPQPQPSPR